MFNDRTEPNSERNSLEWHQFRKKNKLARDTKVFIVIGSYCTLRKALVERGWVENADRNSQVFDLKFAVKQIDVCQVGVPL